jgi:hypothetical protein
MQQLAEALVGMTVETVTKHLKLASRARGPRVLLLSVVLNWQPVSKPAPWFFLKALSIFLVHVRGYLDLENMALIGAGVNELLHSLFAASHHICDYQSEPMMAECHEDTCLIKDAPHATGEFINHIFPTCHTWVVVKVL